MQPYEAEARNNEPKSQTLWSQGQGDSRKPETPRAKLEIETEKFLFDDSRGQWKRRAINQKTL